MEINLSTIISVIALAIAAASMRNVRKMELINDNRLDHNFFIKRYDTLCDEYRKSVDKGELVDSLLAEKMQSLFDAIAYQIKEDKKRTRWSLKDVRDVFDHRHEQWRNIQNEIRVMVYPIELKG